MKTKNIIFIIAIIIIVILLIIRILKWPLIIAGIALVIYWAYSSLFRKKK